MKWKSILGLIAMAGFAGLLLLNFGSQVGGYMTFAEAEGAGRATVVGDSVLAQSYDPEANVFRFRLRDQDGGVKTVTYTGPKPANFDRAEQVVVEGQMEGKAFAADDILVKCPSKYKETEGLQEQAGRSSPSSPPRAEARGD